MAEIFPPSWFVAEARKLVLDFLRGLPVSPQARKWALFEWCEAAGVTMTGEMVEYVTGLPAGSV